VQIGLIIEKTKLPFCSSKISPYMLCNVWNILFGGVWLEIGLSWSFPSDVKESDWNF
jgi:hypothetical protein